MTLNGKERIRSVVMNRLMVGDLTAAAAAERLGRSVRQARRILAASKKEGAAALAHRNRGRPPTPALDPAIRRRAEERARTTDAGLNDTHLAEVLADEEGSVLSRATARRIRVAAGRPGGRAPAGAARPPTVGAARASPRQACCCRWTAATARGWRTGGRG